MTSAKVICSGRGQAVLLPDEFRPTATDFNIQKLGRSPIPTPTDANWSDFFSMLQEVELGNTIKRNQPENSHKTSDIL